MSKTDGEQGDGKQEPEAHPIYPDRGPDREGMVSDYLPEDNDWVAKTELEPTDPAAVAALSQFGELFPEVDDLQDPIDQFLHVYFKSKTSVQGQSRDEYKDIFMSMFGSSPEQQRAASAFVSALGADMDDD